jgi:hypothetical protein
LKFKTALEVKELYLYPKLPARYDVGIRLSGSGLANCLLVYSRAVALSQKHQIKIINPTWRQFNLGPYIRFEKDKRHYFNLFKSIGVGGIKKYILLNTLPQINESDFLSEKVPQDISGIIYVKGLKNYFEDLIEYHPIIKENIFRNINPRYLKSIQGVDFNVVGIHVRLGDYVSELRTDLNWYVQLVQQISQIKPGHISFYVFSDGTDQELQPLLNLPSVKKVFFGSAISDIIALSKCKLIIASDSTFSGWSSFLAQVPTIYPKKHFGKVLANSAFEILLKDFEILPYELRNYIETNL